MNTEQRKLTNTNTKIHKYKLYCIIYIGVACNRLGVWADDLSKLTNTNTKIHKYKLHRTFYSGVQPVRSVGR